ncbi:hypothetical protein ACFOSC_07975 [Streptantibioticus rubrisoli]|uniref:Uncharacterized protein n=1 Tax=Streptantibioticus rubrisoli TaxID=1387313 RepID=A0ABT1P7G5_9ACTN|nr:hypothetical protein [Streptantibioticus rubrisoli]MCQ4041297.1 hypothetical protein [Streptantibioticus rubrisoli]
MTRSKLWLTTLPLLAAVAGGLTAAGGPLASGQAVRHGSCRTLADTGWGKAVPAVASHQVAAKDTGWG